MSEPLPQTAILIVNARSRKGQKLYREAAIKLRSSGVQLIDTHAVRDPKKLSATVISAVETGAPMIIVGGGDGTLSSVVDYVVGKDTVFAVLPLGTANSFARTLDIPLDLDGAVEAIATGRRRRIDLGMIDGDYFANAAAMGLSPLIAETVPHRLKSLLGKVGYAVWAAWSMTKFRPFKLKVWGEDGTHALDALEVRIFNGRYQGGIKLIDDADVDTGEIVVQAVVGRARSYLIWSWLASILGLSSHNPTTQNFRGSSFRLETVPAMPISIDGEVVARTPCTVRVAASVIDVAVPASNLS